MLHQGRHVRRQLAVKRDDREDAEFIGHTKQCLPRVVEWIAARARLHSWAERAARADKARSKTSGFMRALLGGDLRPCRGRLRAIGGHMGNVRRFGPRSLRGQKATIRFGNSAWRSVAVRRTHGGVATSEEKTSMMVRNSPKCLQLP
jgi:hypothetical protein